MGKIMLTSRRVSAMDLAYKQTAFAVRQAS